MGDTVRGKLVQFRSGQSSYVVGNATTDGRGNCKAVLGAKGKSQSFQSRDAANEGDIIQVLLCVLLSIQLFYLIPLSSFRDHYTKHKQSVAVLQSSTGSLPDGDGSFQP